MKEQWTRDIERAGLSMHAIQLEMAEKDRYIEELTRLYMTYLKKTVELEQTVAVLKEELTIALS